MFSWCFIFFIVISKDIEKDTSVKSDAIFVLGARSYRNGTYNPCLQARVDHAVILYKEGKSDKLVFSGGTDREDNANEAEVMKKIAVEQGVSPDVIYLEKSSTSTYENFYLSQQVFDQQDIHSIIIVTEPFHMPRATLIAQKLGINYSVSPAVESRCWTQNKYLSRYFLKEPLVIYEYKLQGEL